MLCTYILVYSEQDDEMRAQETVAVAINCQGKSENYFICVLGRKGGAKVVGGEVRMVRSRPKWENAKMQKKLCGNWSSTSNEKKKF